MPDQRGERRSPGGYRTSVLGRVDWSCWLAAVGFLFLTVVSVLVQFAILGVITAILAVGLVAFDSWVNRPKGFRARRAATRADTGGGRGTGWQNSAVNNRAVNNRARPQNFRRPTTVGQPQRHQPPPRPLNGQPPRQPASQPTRQPQRQQPGQQRQQPPPRQPPPMGQPPAGQPPQGQPPRPPYRPSPPDPGRARR